VKVSHKKAAADLVMRVDKATLEALVTGRSNGTAAILRGALAYQGSLAPFVMFQRIFPGPPHSKGRVPPISGEMVMAQKEAS
jgi:SCP-2 sterol transfer family